MAKFEFIHDEDDPVDEQVVRRMAQELGDQIVGAPDEVEAIGEFTWDAQEFFNKYKRDPSGPLEWLRWRADRRRQEYEMTLEVLGGGFRKH